MKKLFLWTFVLTLLCTWAIVGADQTPNVPTISSQGPDLDREAIKAQKDKAAAMLLEKEKATAEPQRISGPEAMQVIEVAPPDLDELERQKNEARRNRVRPKPNGDILLEGGEDCASATPVGALPFTDNGYTCDNTHEYDEICPYDHPGSPDVVYAYTPGVDVEATITLCVGITDYDTKLYVYEDVCQVPDDGFPPYACNDDYCSAPNTYVSYIECLPMYAGHTYYIVIDGFWDDCGNYTMEINPCLPPTGACCDDATGDCVDNVPVEECPPPLRFALGVLCANLEPPCGEVPGACCDPATGDCIEMTESECADAWGGTGDYQGDWTSCDPNPCPNPFCHDYSVTAPVSGETGTTCGMGNDCDLRPSEEVIYEVEIPEDGDWYFSLCGSGFDTYLYMGTTCCGAEVGENDDFCGLQSQLNAVITAGTYYVAIEGYSTACGPYELNIWMEGGCDEFIVVDIFTDEYPSETTWEVIERVSGTVVGSGGPLSDPETQHHWEVCGDPALCYDFYIYDAFGNGICCLNGEGHYEIYDFNGEMVCSGGEFASVDVCPDIGNCLPQTGACCIDEVCEFNSEVQPCLDAGGTWFIGQTCPEFNCPEPMRSCDDAVYNNGPDDNINTAVAACHLDIALVAETADDFTLEDDATIDWISFDVGFWNPGGYDPSVWDAVSLVIYNDDDGVPGGNPVYADCSHEGDVLWTHEYGPGEYQWVPTHYGFKVDVSVDPGVEVIGGTTYWLGVMAHQSLTSYGQVGWRVTATATGSPALLWADWPYYWHDPYGGINMVFCLFLEGEPCVYSAGDCNCNGIPAELADVIAMIGMYRGTVEHCYECNCGPHGIFAPSADPNGNCVSDELSDAVAEIGIYRGTVLPASCADCPGSRRLLPGGDNQPMLAPLLKSKTRIRKPSGVD